MTPSDLLAGLKGRGITLQPEGDALRYSAPKGAMTDDLRAAIREHKAALLALLSAGQAGQVEAQSSPAPRIPDNVAEEIGRIEAEALALGWTHEELWEPRFWNIGTDGVNRPGLAAVMFPGYRIAEVTQKAVVLLAGPREHRLTFRHWPKEAKCHVQP
ncbi:MAG TPA: hypothetical protein GX513_05965 [Firmicutes bacterium]|nr:hypothetical protein [Bacillota bacterium]